jgi:hypothetical protein
VEESLRKPSVGGDSLRCVATDDEVERLLADCPDEIAEVTRRLRKVLRDGHPQLAEAVRTGWRSINYRDPQAGFVCALFPQHDGVQLVFEHGARLPDPHGMLTGTGRQVRVLPFRTEDDVDADVVLEYLDLAVELGAGLRGR